MSSQFDLLDRRVSVLRKLPKAFREKFYKIFAQSPRIKTQNWFFERKSPKIFLWTRVMRFSTLPEIIQPNWKIYSIVQNYVFFQKIPVVTEEAGVTTIPTVFLLGVKSGWESKTVSFSLVFPQIVPLEMMNANLTTLPFSFEVAKEFHIMCGNKTTLILPNRFNFSALFHWTGEGSLTILPNVFCPNSETSHYCKCFQKIVFFSKSFPGQVKVFFDRLAENKFCQKLY